MEPANRGRRRLYLTLFFFLAGGIVAGSDLWTKVYIFDLLQVESVGEPPYIQSQREIKVIENYFWLEASYNRGAFNGWFSGQTWALALLSGVAVLAIAGIAIWHIFKNTQPEVLLTLSLALLWGGTLGNLYDRAAIGAVRDWIRWFVVIDGTHHVWPNFNIADSGICVGVVLLICRELVVSRRQKRARKDRKEKAAVST